MNLLCPGTARGQRSLLGGGWNILGSDRLAIHLDHILRIMGISDGFMED